MLAVEQDEQSCRGLSFMPYNQLAWKLVAGRPVFLAAQFTPQIFVAIVFMKTLMAARIRHLIAKD